MTDKTEAQRRISDALAQADRAEAAAINYGEGTTLGLEAYASAKTIRTQADRIASQEAEKLKLQELAASCYAGLGGECDLPEHWLDSLNSAASGEPFETDSLLPFVSPMRAELIKQTNRAAEAEQQVTALTQRLETANALNTEARNQLAQLSQAQALPTEGWKLVPVEPTLEMYEATWEVKTYVAFDRFKDDYDLMLAASPTPARKGLSDAEKAAVIEEWIASRIQGEGNE